MPHGEAEHGCAQGDACRPGHQDQQAPGKHHNLRRSPVGTPQVAEPVVRPAEEDPPVPRQRGGDCVDPEPVRAASCRSDLPGWAGAHRHGPVRPSQRATRRERPPRRWC